MQITHGVSTGKQETAISTPVTANSGVHFIVGTAPVHTVGGKTNEVIIAYNYQEAVKALGYSDDWRKYSLCEEIYTAFKLYNISPVIFVNVLDPEKHKKQVEQQELEIVEGQAKMPIDVIKDTVTVTGHVKGEDYDLFYDGEYLILEAIEGGGITSETTKLTVTYSVVDIEKVKDEDVIGGYNVSTHKVTGLELIDSVFPKYTIVPDLILCPNWSHKSEVAAVMAAKAENINGVFGGKAIIDVDTKEVTHYTEVAAWKKKNNINNSEQILCFPMVKLGEKTFRYSTQVAGRMTATDTSPSLGDGTPCESPSNKLLKIDSTVLEDGTEVMLDLQQANNLNENGVVTALNFVGGFVLWGNETACYPFNTDVTDYFICVSRMFKWVANSLILSHWSKVDKKLNRRLIDSVVDSVNIWLNGLTSEEKLLGGHVAFLEEENSLTSIMGGKVKFHIYLTPPSPAKKIEFMLEYDVSYLQALLEA